ncbi:TPA: hypothetical protein OL574_000432 [Klebsiella pneumoniae]|nr:hypothetical protein [Klebsiella pneumoniae]
MTKSTITREQLLEIIETDHVQCGEASYLARMALAAMDSEPVIVVGDDGGDALSYRRLIQSFEPGTKLYRHAQPAPVSYSDFEEFWSAYIHPLAQDDELKDFSWGIWNACVSNSQPAPVVPDGYVMVPKEMTDEIGEAIAMQANCCGGIALDIYDAMLAAATQEVKP